MSGHRERIFDESGSTRAGLLEPLRDGALAPYAALCELRERLGEALDPGELVGPLPANSEHLADLCCADKFHPETLHNSLDTVKSRVHTTLDSVKRESTMKERPAHRFAKAPFHAETFGLGLIRHYEQLGMEKYFTPEQIAALMERKAILEATQ